MDLKSLAKSKRAHSQHHSKKHHSKPTTAKAPTPRGGASTANKQSGKGVGDKPGQSQGSKGLPSNRDRYEEDYDLDLDDQLKNSNNSGTDVFVPKSKGADYMYLLSEAKLQSDANSSSEVFPSFDDIFTDFNEGLGLLLSARGESILSWTGDDNFIVEDKATFSHEATFLSLNLYLLAEQLEKVDLPTRLFIEPDLFLPEVSSGDLSVTDEVSVQVQVASQSQQRENVSDELLNDHPNKDNMKDGESKVDLLINSFSSTEFLNRFDSKKYKDTLSEQPKKADLSSSDDVTISFGDDLDDLLKATSPSLSQEISFVELAPTEPRVKCPEFSGSGSNLKSFDDDLDNLLVETLSNIKNSQGSSSLNIHIDDELDVVLKETLSKRGTSHETGSSSNLLVSDDFDSFFDTL